MTRDYLTTGEAAAYVGVSVRTWRRKARTLGLLPIRFMGKYLYRLADLRRAIEREATWQHSDNAARLSTLITQRRQARESARA